MPKSQYMRFSKGKRRPQKEVHDHLKWRKQVSNVNKK